jgi:hypothetical protein
MISCKTVEPAKSIHLKGHYTLGSGPAIFVSDGTPEKLYIVLADDMPDEVYKYLSSQPKHVDMSRESNESVSAFAEVQGVVLKGSNGYPRLKAMKVSSLKPAKGSYVERWKTATSWPES